MCLSNALPPVGLASERTDHPARSSHGVARNRNGIDHVSGVPTVANPTTRTRLLAWRVRCSGRSVRFIARPRPDYRAAIPGASAILVENVPSVEAVMNGVVPRSTRQRGPNLSPQRYGRRRSVG